MKALFRRSARSSLWNNQHAIREELFSVERLEAHGRTLAAAQAVAAKPVRGHPLAGRLADNASVLLKSHAAIARVADQGGAITPAALWLLDNYYLIERQIHDIRLNLPPGYYRLAGSELKRTQKTDLLSHAVLPGTIQVPPNGQPIVLMSDAQTTGGYPKIGAVIQADMWKLAQPFILRSAVVIRTR